jgi:hypothetical protein
MTIENDDIEQVLRPLRDMHGRDRRLLWLSDIPQKLLSQSWDHHVCDWIVDMFRAEMECRAIIAIVRPTAIEGGYLVRTIAIIALMLSAASPSYAAKSIVGRWGSDGEACSYAPTTIFPMSIDSPELRCRFSSVSRSGETVTWKGSCGRVFGKGVPDATVTARRYEDGMHERIALRVNGGVEYDYVRCR